MVKISLGESGSSHKALKVRGGLAMLKTRLILIPRVLGSGFQTISYVVVHWLAMNKTKMRIFRNVARVWLVNDPKTREYEKMEGRKLQITKPIKLPCIVKWRTQSALNALGCQKSKRNIETEAIMFGPHWHGARESRVKRRTAYGTFKNLTSLRDHSQLMCVGHFEFWDFFTLPPSDEYVRSKTLPKWKCPTVFWKSQDLPPPRKNVHSDINCEWSLRYRRMLQTWDESRKHCQWERRSSTLQGLLRFVKDVLSFASPPTYTVNLGLTHDS